ncbi:MAG: hypothetical protein HOO95_04145 [Gallionella sp.]|nr:hypothetical protein [Gallionella sp.]
MSIVADTGIPTSWHAPLGICITTVAASALLLNSGSHNNIRIATSFLNKLDMGHSVGKHALNVNFLAIRVQPNSKRNRIIAEKISFPTPSFAWRTFTSPAHSISADFLKTLV